MVRSPGIWANVMISDPKEYQTCMFPFAFWFNFNCAWNCPDATFLSSSGSLLFLKQPYCGIASHFQCVARNTYLETPLTLITG